MAKFFAFFVLFILTSYKVFAGESSLGLANFVPIKEVAGDGQLITSTPNGYILSKIAYDPQIVGVVSENPAISIGEKTEGLYGLVSSGVVFVKVNGLSGNIALNDPVTSSGIPGIAMKAVKPGYVLGNAMESASFAQKDEVKSIKVSLNVHYFAPKYGYADSLGDIFNLSQIATYQEPLRVFRYVMAGFVVVLSVILSFLSFGRSAALGIEAIGRNPRASKIIQLGIALNVIITVVIALAGLGIGVFILRV